MEEKYIFSDEWLIRALKGFPELPLEKIEWFRKTKKPSLSEATLQAGILSLETLTRIIQDTYRVPVTALKVEDIDKMALSLVPEKVCRRRQLIPFRLERENLHVAMLTPLDVDALADVQTFSGRTPTPHFCLPSQINSLFNLIFSPEFYLQDVLNRLEKPDELQDKEIQEAIESKDTPGLKDGESSIIRLVELIIKKAITMRASDIHLEHEDNKSMVRFRIDGLLKNILVLPKDLGTGSVVARIKIISNLDIADHYRPQDGRAIFRFQNAEIGFRVSILPTNNGEKVVMRLLDKRAAEVPFEGLGFSPTLSDRLSQMVKSEQGIILVTGPTGSGKTTTLYSALNKLKAEHTNITTVEDPIEYRLEGINQVQVNEKQGLTFPNVLRSVLRQDPDIILVGEIRDLETAKIAIQAAMTGHLVFSTLHTNDAMSTIERLRDIGIEPYKIASCLLGVTAQRLVRRLCPHCKVEIPSEKINSTLRTALLGENLKPIVFKHKGCKQCHFTGYKGQIPLLELWDLDNDVKKSIAAGDIQSTLQECALANKSLQLLWKDALWQISQGNTSLDEVRSFLNILGSFDDEEEMLPIPQVSTTIPSFPKKNENQNHILIVDDDQTIRQVYTSILENEGFQVTSVQNGLEAINTMVNFKFDLILLDLMMPTMNGSEVLKSLRQIMGFEDIPVIVLTAVTDEKIKNEILTLGADDYLIKPSSPTTVVGRVKSLLKRKKDSGHESFNNLFGVAA
ncbi:MAG: ATPase, T2SS/T4P/T4SS family [Elusimicrobiota bacterium]